MASFFCDDERTINNRGVYTIIAEYRPDNVARVAYFKFAELIRDLDNRQVFGKAAAYVYTIEFQKRGLPHMHLLIILRREDKTHNNEELDDLVSRENVLQLKKLFRKLIELSLISSILKQQKVENFFPDSDIAKRYACRKTKSTWILNLALAPYYTNDLVDRMKKKPFRVSNRWIK